MSSSVLLVQTLRAIDLGLTVSPGGQLGDDGGLRRANQDLRVCKGHLRRLRNGGFIGQLATQAHLRLQLNLKNDLLRRRYDSLKYDIKKIEEGESDHCFIACV
jgi:hypothetical protein